MKKRKTILLIVLGVAVLAVVTGLLLCFVNRDRKVPLLLEDGLSFGKSEGEICSILGVPDEQFQDYASVHSFMKYELVVAGHPALVTFYINGETDELWQVIVTWKTESTEQLNDIRTLILSELKNELGAFLNGEESNVYGGIRKPFRVVGYDIVLTEGSNNLKLRIRSTDLLFKTGDGSLS